jgi:hypothetical protein
VVGLEVVVTDWFRDAALFLEGFGAGRGVLCSTGGGAAAWDVPLSAGGGFDIFDFLSSSQMRANNAGSLPLSSLMRAIIARISNSSLAASVVGASSVADAVGAASVCGCVSWGA